MFNRNRFALASIAALASVGASAQAAPPDFTALTAAADFSTVGTALLAIGAVMMIPKIVGWGTKKVLGFVRG